MDVTLLRKFADAPGTLDVVDLDALGAEFGEALRADAVARREQAIKAAAPSKADAMANAVVETLAKSLKSRDARLAALEQRVLELEATKAAQAEIDA